MIDPIDLCIQFYLNTKEQVKYYGLSSLDRYQRRCYITGKKAHTIFN